MPELPEVETTRRGIEPHLLAQRIDDVQVRETRLRWPVPDTMARLRGQSVLAVRRRAKYLLIDLEQDVLMIHLGMSGSLRLEDQEALPRRHDHVDFALSGGRILRYHDPRRFGSMHLLKPPGDAHPLLDHLGPEPLGNEFHGGWLFAESRRRKIVVKSFIMDAAVVVGVGNIYASEALFLAGIRPNRPAGQIGEQRYDRLAQEIRRVLSQAIKCGGTTLRDFVGSDGAPGYFAQQLEVYGREGEPCGRCEGVVRRVVIGQRSTFYCPHCQT